MRDGCVQVGARMIERNFGNHVELIEKRAVKPVRHRVLRPLALEGDAGDENGLAIERQIGFDPGFEELVADEIAHELTRRCLIAAQYIAKFAVFAQKVDHAVEFARKESVIVAHIQDILAVGLGDEVADIPVVALVDFVFDVLDLISSLFLERFDGCADFETLGRFVLADDDLQVVCLAVDCVQEAKKGVGPVVAGDADGEERSIHFAFALITF